MEKEASQVTKVRCPACGALNGASAQWCGQCLRPFAPPAPTAPEPPAPAPRPKAKVSPLLTDAPPAEAVGSQRGAFRVTETGILWTCSICETENPMELTHCTACGAAFADTVRPPEPERVSRDPGTTAIFSMLFPGAGHAYLGLWGQAVARGVIFLWTVFTAFIGAIQKTGGTLIAAVFGLAAVLVWGLTAHDAYQEASRRPNAVFLKGKVFLYLVLGLLLLLIVLLVSAGFSARTAVDTASL